tara:strand:- start:179 stop:1054 length:876 start_codon:yes stop_codon:yes gene_type:complete
MKNLSKRINIEEFLSTYENNPWEKMSIMALREFSQQTLIIGYQHTIVAQAFVSSFISHYEKDIMPLPDKIFTVGEITKNILEEYGEYDNNYIESSCSLRYEYFNNVSMISRKSKGNILLVLDGVPEISRMVNYVVGELKDNLKYQLKIRPHPVLPLKKFLDRLDYNLYKISNVSVSENTSVIDDLSSTDIVIYWGSSVALEAIKVGIPVIYYNNNMESFLCYDPLFQFDHFKWEVDNNDSLANKIEEIYSMSDENFNKEKQEAMKYINRYFHPVTEDCLRKFIVNKDKINE